MHASDGCNIARNLAFDLLFLEITRLILRLAISARRAGLPSAVVVIAITVIAPRAVPVALWAYAKVAAVAFAKGRDVCVAAQEALTRLRAYGETLAWFHGRTSVANI
jgi:hypothetical protein